MPGVLTSYKANITGVHPLKSKNNRCPPTIKPICQVSSHYKEDMPRVLTSYKINRTGVLPL